MNFHPYMRKGSLLFILLSFLNWGCTNIEAEEGNRNHLKSNEGSYDLGNLTAEMWEYEEWSLKNPTWKGNPFDLVATVTFQHGESGISHTTEMFYDNEDTWKFRFTGTRKGKWTFKTSSKDPDLDDLGGTVIVTSNPDPNSIGFLTFVDNKFAVQTKDADTLQGYLFNVYMNGVDFPDHVGNWKSSQDTSAYLQDALNSGSEIIHFSVDNSWFKFGTRGHNEHNSNNPDIQTFEVLEKLIVNTHKQGGRVHLWVWGDEARKWTPKGVDGGINGKADRRLQRYIAARLGPIPGWTMAYGFDLEEWVSEKQTSQWAKYLQDHMGWQHLIWARGRSNSELDVKSYSDGHRPGRGGPFDYDNAVERLESDPLRPHLFEERFTYKRGGGIFTMDVTRRLHWQYAMAGGIGSWWGFFHKDYGKVDPSYPNPEQLQTHYKFWHENDRFKLNMSRANDLTNGYGLKTSDNMNYVFYRENTDSMQIDLSKMNGKQTAVAINTKKEYGELNLGILEPKNQTIKLSEVSDWAIAIGKFKQ